MLTRVEKQCVASATRQGYCSSVKRRSERCATSAFGSSLHSLRNNLIAPTAHRRCRRRRRATVALECGRVGSARREMHEVRHLRCLCLESTIDRTLIKRPIHDARPTQMWQTRGPEISIKGYAGLFLRHLPCEMSQLRCAICQRPTRLHIRRCESVRRLTKIHDRPIHVPMSYHHDARFSVISSS